MSTLWEKQAPSRVQKPEAEKAPAKKPAAEAAAKKKPASKAAKKA